MTLNRRDAILISLGQADRVALERERQSALDVARGDAATAAPEPTAHEPAPASRLRRALARLRALFG